MEKTLVIIKPDAMQRGLGFPILGRLEARGLRLAALKMMQMTPDLARRHYAVHEGKPFFEGLVRYICSSPVLVAVFDGPGAVAATRAQVGATNPQEAAPGTIRGDWSLEIGRNLVHASDSVETAEYEVGLFFQKGELLAYPRATDPWITESD